MTTLDIPTPRWALPYLRPMRYKGLKGGRASAKSHFFAELVVETLITDPDTDVVCLREILRSLKFSAKKLIEQKIVTFGVADLFQVLENEIRRRGPEGSRGRIIFQGMQDHTAESIKSLEGFNISWFEEASRMSQRSLELLRPTIREPDSELWFSWNPDQPTDPIEEFLVHDPPENSITTHLTFESNPFCPQVVRDEAELWLRKDSESYDHIWGGAYNTKADDQILGGRWEVNDFEVNPSWAGPYYGADWGFSTDPNTVVVCYVDTDTNRLYIRHEAWGLHIEVDDTPEFFDRIDGTRTAVIRADSARPEMISHMKNNGFRGIIAAEKWPGSVEDGISKLRSFDRIVLHSSCVHAEEEARLYKYKRDRLTDEVLPIIIDKWNHIWDAIRYAIEPLTKRARRSFWD